MLKNLLKHELRATARIFLPLYALLIIFTAVNRFFLAVNIGGNHSGSMKDRFPFLDNWWIEMVEFLSMTVFIAIIVGICVMTLVVTVQRFYKNLLGEEGYLMNTLPVTVDQQVVSKLLISMLWQIASFFMAVASVFLLVVDGNTIRGMGRFFQELGELFSEYRFAWPITFEIILLMLVSLVSGVLMIYAAIVVGGAVSRHRLLASFGVLVGFNFAESTISGCLMALLERPLSDWNAEIVRINTPEAYAGFAQAVLLMSIALCVAFAIAFYFITRYMLNKHLNLE